MNRIEKRGVQQLRGLAPYLNGVAVDVLRQSKTTGGYTVRLREPSPTATAYQAGTELHVNGYNLEAATAAKEE